MLKKYLELYLTEVEKISVIRSFFSTLIFVTPYIRITNEVLFFMTTLSWILIILFSPVVTSQKPIITKTKYIYCKIMSAIITGCSFIGLVFLMHKGHAGIFFTAAG